MNIAELLSQRHKFTREMERVIDKHKRSRIGEQLGKDLKFFDITKERYDQMNFNAAVQPSLKPEI